MTTRRYAVKKNNQPKPQNIRHLSSLSNHLCYIGSTNNDTDPFRSTWKGSSTSGYTTIRCSAGVGVYNAGISAASLYKTSDVIPKTMHQDSGGKRNNCEHKMFVRAPRLEVVRYCVGAAPPLAVATPSITTLDPLRTYTLPLLSFPAGSLLSPSLHSRC